MVVLRLVAFALAAAAAACAGIQVQAGSDGALPLAAEHSTLSAQRLAKLGSLTAFDALQTMPSYVSPVHQGNAPRVVLILDGSKSHDLELLKGIKASEVFEIRVVGDIEADVPPGDLEVRVTTLGRRNRVR
jgi:hypothetical protein